MVSLAVLAEPFARRRGRFGYERWGCRMGLRFPVVSLAGYRERQAELDASCNPAWRQGSVAGMTEIPGYLRVVIRADASIEMGSGHVMRCLTLADALRERAAVVRLMGAVDLNREAWR